MNPAKKKSDGDGLDVEVLKRQIASLEKELATCREELTKREGDLAARRAETDRWKDTAARAQADLQNARMRLEREASDLRKFATEQIILRILPTLDNFARAFQHIPTHLQKEEWVKGVTAIDLELMRQLSDAGLTKMQSLGQSVDPTRHEILMSGPGEQGKVIEVLEEGYELHGKVIRPAKVKVGEGTSSTQGRPRPS